MNFKKGLFTILAAILIMGMVGCGKEAQAEQADTQQDSGKTVITVGTSVISKDVLEVAQKVFNEENTEYQMEVKVFDDAITPNVAVDDGSIQANFYQYEDYLNNFNKDRNTELVTYGKEIFAFQIGLYSETVKDIASVEDGMTVAIANDASNRALALTLLAQEGLIQIKEGVEAPTILDIEENPHNLKFVEMERLNLASALSDTDMAVVMADVMLNAGKDSENALAFAQEEGIILVLKEEQPWAEAVENALTSEAVKTYILEETKGTKTPLF